MHFIAMFLGAFASFLMSGIVAKLVIALIVNGLILGAIFLFMKNISGTSLDYAISFFEFFGFGDNIAFIQNYYMQLPQGLLDTLAYFQLGPMVGFIINNYIAGIFLAWIMRKFG